MHECVSGSNVGIYSCGCIKSARLGDAMKLTLVPVEAAPFWNYIRWHAWIADHRNTLFGPQRLRTQGANDGATPAGVSGARLHWQSVAGLIPLQETTFHF